jgi:pyridoxine 5-phosphate synthase
MINVKTILRSARGQSSVRICWYFGGEITTTLENVTRLSVNINKIATLRNARGGNNPNLLKVAEDCERFGAQGITVHPRPDERHIRYSDVMHLSQIVKTEFNIEGYPDKRYLEMVKKVKPAQATLVPDPPNVLTSNAGWDTIKQAKLLKQIITEIKEEGVRVSVFVNADEAMVEGAAAAGADRIELYTEPYAAQFGSDKNKAVRPYITAAQTARQCGLLVNAGHDLDLHNLRFLKQSIPWLAEVSIGHALICDALYLGLENTVQLYLRQLI